MKKMERWKITFRALGFSLQLYWIMTSEMRNNHMDIFPALCVEIN